ncbi:MAG: AAA family ATPase [Bacillota bacterium]
MVKTRTETYCLIIRSNPTSNWRDAEGQSYQYGQTVPRYKQIQPGVRFVMDRREGNNVVLVGHGVFGAIEDDGVDEKGRRRYRVRFREFTPFPESKALPEHLRKEIAQQPRFNQQHSIREIPPALYTKLVAFGFGQPDADSVLNQFCTELKNLRMDRSSGWLKLYKPLMLLAAVRTLVEGGNLSFGLPLLGHYRAFARAVGEDDSHPEYPYYYLQSEGFWTVLDSAGQPIEHTGTPHISTLRETTVQLETERAKCIRDPAQRGTILETLLSHFSDWQVAALFQEWPEPKEFVSGRGVTPMNEASQLLRLIHEYVIARGFYFTLPQIAAFYCALRTKPFVILAGISGTGKTRLPRLFAEAIGAKFRLEAVRPDWADSADLIGYRDLKERFRPGRLLAFARQATESPTVPHFFILDEMNLARVEHYLADVLSKIESRRREGDVVVTDRLVAPEELSNDPEAEIWREIGLPENLFIIGTVNMDETTHGFSRKVLDRAFTLEFSEVDLSFFGPESAPETATEQATNGLNILKPLALTPASLTSRRHLETRNRLVQLLSRINTSLEKAQLQVGYRVRDEACLFACHASEVSDIFPMDQALDYVLCAKILPRIHGGATALQEAMLDLLKLTLFDHPNASDVNRLRELITDTRRGDLALRQLLENRPQGTEAFRYPLTANKLFIMLERLDRDGYTSYWL